jgi:adenine-specific DNA methylase
MFEALPGYLGGKRAILAQIFREVARHLDPSDWKHASFIDGFVGGGAVSLYAKAQFREVLGNDIADRSALVARAILENNDRTLDQTDAYLMLAGADSIERYCETKQSDWFIPETARIIDRGLAYADTLADRLRADLIRICVWRVIMKARPSNGTFTSRNLVERALEGEIKPSGVLDAKYAYRPPDLRDIEKFIRWTNHGIFRGKYRFTQADAIEESKSWGADVVYLDPPYAGDSGYQHHYHIADCVMAQKELPKEAESPFGDKRRAAEALETVVGNVARAGAKIVLLNNSDEGVSRESLLGIVGAHFEAQEVPIIHNHGAGTRKS